MNESSNCYFSNEPAEISPDQMKNVTYVKSKICGYYWIEDSVLDQIERIEQETKVKFGQGHANCAKQTILTNKTKTIPFWTIKENVAYHEENFPKIYPNEHYTILSFDDPFHEEIDHSFKPMRLLTILGQKLSRTRAYSRFKVTPQDAFLSGVVDREELGQIFRYLANDKLISLHNSPHDGFEGKIFEFDIQLTPLGWEKIRVETELTNSNKAFIATSFTWPDDKPIKQIEAINAIKRACSNLGYIANIVSQNHTENITDKIISEIKKSRFIISELTYNNRGVYYESGFARGIGKPVFHLVHKDFAETDHKFEAENKKIHFDIQQIMYRKWETAEDLESQLTDWIMATIGKYKA